MLTRYLKQVSDDLIDREQEEVMRRSHINNEPVPVLIAGISTSIPRDAKAGTPVRCLAIGRRIDGHLCAITFNSPKAPGFYIKIPKYISDDIEISDIFDWISYIDGIIRDDPNDLFGIRLDGHSSGGDGDLYETPTLPSGIDVKCSFEEFQDGYKCEFGTTSRFMRVEFNRINKTASCFIDRLKTQWECFKLTKYAKSLADIGVIMDDRVVRNISFIGFKDFYKQVQIDHGDSLCAPVELHNYTIVSSNACNRVPSSFVCYSVSTHSDIRKLGEEDPRVEQLYNQQVVLSYDIETYTSFPQRAKGEISNPWKISNYVMLISIAIARVKDDKPIARFTLSLKTPTDEEKVNLSDDAIFSYDFVDTSEFMSEEEDQSRIIELDKGSISMALQCIAPLISSQGKPEHRRPHYLVDRQLKDMICSDFRLGKSSDVIVNTKYFYDRIVRSMIDNKPESLVSKILTAESQMLKDFFTVINTIVPTSIIAFNNYSFDNLYIAVRTYWWFYFTMLSRPKTMHYDIDVNKVRENPNSIQVYKNRSCKYYEPIVINFRFLSMNHLSFCKSFLSWISLRLTELQNQHGPTGKLICHMCSTYISNIDHSAFLQNNFDTDSQTGFLKLSYALESFDIRDHENTPVSKTDLSIPEMYDKWAANSLVDPINYCSRDAAVLIYGEKRWCSLLSVMSRSAICGLNFSESAFARGGRQNSVTLSKTAKDMNMLVYDRPVYGTKYRMFSKTTMVGGEVKAEQIGATSPGSATDFDSMYPSMPEGKSLGINTQISGKMFLDNEIGEKTRAYHNVQILATRTISDPFGIRRRFFVKETTENRLFIVEEMFATIKAKDDDTVDATNQMKEVTRYLLDDGNRFVSYDPVTTELVFTIFVLQHHMRMDATAIDRFSFHGAMLNIMRHERANIRGRMKLPGVSAGEKRVLDARQGGIKIISNSVYGTTGSKVQGFYDLELGAAITHQSRRGINTLTRLIMCEDFIIPESRGHDMKVPDLVETLNEAASLWFKKPNTYTTLDYVVVEPNKLPRLQSSKFNIDTNTGLLTHPYRPNLEFIDYDCDNLFTIEESYIEKVFSDITLYIDNVNQMVEIFNKYGFTQESVTGLLKLYTCDLEIDISESAYVIVNNILYNTINYLPHHVSTYKYYDSTVFDNFKSSIGSIVVEGDTVSKLNKMDHISRDSVQMALSKLCEDSVVTSDIGLYIYDAWYPPSDWDKTPKDLRLRGTKFSDIAVEIANNIGITADELNTTQLLTVYELAPSLGIDRPYLLGMRVKMPAGRMVYQDTDSNYFVSDYLMTFITEHPGDEVMTRVRYTNLSQNRLVAALTSIIFNANPIGVSYEGGMTESQITKPKTYLGRTMDEHTGVAREFYNTDLDDIIDYGGNRLKYLKKKLEIFVKGHPAFKRDASPIEFIYTSELIKKRFGSVEIWNRLHAHPIPSYGLRKLPTVAEVNLVMEELQKEVIDQFCEDILHDRLPIQAFIKYHKYTNKEHNDKNQLLMLLPEGVRPKMGTRVPYVIEMTPATVHKLTEGKTSKLKVAERIRFFVGDDVPENFSIDRLDIRYYSEGLIKKLAATSCIGTGSMAKDIGNKVISSLSGYINTKLNLDKEYVAEVSKTERVSRIRNVIGGRIEEHAAIVSAMSSNRLPEHIYSITQKGITYPYSLSYLKYLLDIPNLRYQSWKDVVDREHKTKINKALMTITNVTGWFLNKLMPVVCDEIESLYEQYESIVNIPTNFSERVDFNIKKFIESGGRFQNKVTLKKSSIINDMVTLAQDVSTKYVQTYDNLTKGITKEYILRMQTEFSQQCTHIIRDVYYDPKQEDISEVIFGSIPIVDDLKKLGTLYLMAKQVNRDILELTNTPVNRQLPIQL